MSKHWFPGATPVPWSSPRRCRSTSAPTASLGFVSPQGSLPLVPELLQHTSRQARPAPGSPSWASWPRPSMQPGAAPPTPSESRSGRRWASPQSEALRKGFPRWAPGSCCVLSAWSWAAGRPAPGVVRRTRALVCAGCATREKCYSQRGMLAQSAIDRRGAPSGRDPRCRAAIRAYRSDDEASSFAGHTSPFSGTTPAKGHLDQDGHGRIQRPSEGPMNTNSIVAFLFVGTSILSGCAASVDSGGQGSPEVTATSVEKLTTSQCATQRDTCLQKNPLFGLFVCPAQYTQCVATASNGLPAQVTSAISDAAACTNTYLSCTSEAGTASAAVACATTEAECVASIVQVHLPPVVTGTETCVTSSVSCINAAEQVSDSHDLREQPRVLRRRPGPVGRPPAGRRGHRQRQWLRDRPEHLHHERGDAGSRDPVLGDRGDLHGGRPGRHAPHRLGLRRHYLRPECGQLRARREHRRRRDGVRHDPHLVRRLGGRRRHDAAFAAHLPAAVHLVPQQESAEHPRLRRGSRGLQELTLRPLPNGSARRARRRFAFLFARAVC